MAGCGEVVWVVGVASVVEWLYVVDGVGWVVAAVGAGVVISGKDGEAYVFPLGFASDVAFACCHFNTSSVCLLLVLLGMVIHNVSWCR